MAVKVQFEIGHSSKLRSKKTAEGFTHDWELYVQGVNKADISAFVEKVVFNLHDSFPKPKRVYKEPPYVIQESGYAGFVLPIDIYFRNRDEPKRVQFTYELDLQQTGPPQHRFGVQKFIFDCPTEEFRVKLLRGGGVPVSGVVSGGTVPSGSGVSTLNSVVQANVESEGGMVSKPKLSSSDMSGKKHKSRTDESKLSTFATLFGPPITKSGVPSKHSPEGKTGGVGGGKGSGGLPAVPTTGAAYNNASNNNAAGNVAVRQDKTNKDREKVGSSVAPISGGSGNAGATAGGEKLRDKSEKKEKYKQSSPHKEARGSECKKSTSSEGSSKHEKRSDESKSKKDKTRDKEHERSREKAGGSGATKRPPSPKSSGRDLGQPSPKRATPPRSSSSASGRGMEESKLTGNSKTEAEGKSRDGKPKEQSSSSSGKKSKKEKKDKEKDRDREKRDEHRDKHRAGEVKTKDERLSANGGATNPSNAQTSVAALAAATAGDMKDSKAGGGAAKKVDKDQVGRSEPLTKQRAMEKSNTEKDAVIAHASTAGPGVDKRLTAGPAPGAMGANEKDKKSHKHKKKEKSKDKEKERDKEREREKDRIDKAKEREREREKEKAEDKSGSNGDKPTEPNSAAAALPMTAETSKTEANQKATGYTNAAAANPAAVAAGSATAGAATVVAATKKSQGREKKPKDKSIKEDKRQRTTAAEPLSDSKSNKHTKNSASSHNNTPTSTGSSASSAFSACAPLTVAAKSQPQLDLSDADSAHSTHDLATQKSTSAVAVVAGSTATPSDSSNSSFPDMPSATAVKANNNRLLPPNAKVTGKEQKPRGAEKNAKATVPVKSDKATDKEDKKRRRSSTVASTFIEPPSKQAKRDQSKAAREKSKSPSLRAIGRTAVNNNASGTNNNNIPQSSNESGSAGFLPPPNSASVASPAAANTAAANSANHGRDAAVAAAANIVPPPLHPASPALACDAVSNTTAALSSASANNGTIISAALPTEYLSELQELHHKIMTLQDNDELQQVVELIAATGCYEITAKTFDFDLCKLDRNTVQRLQEFFATSVS